MQLPEDLENTPFKQKYEGKYPANLFAVQSWISIFYPNVYTDMY